MGKKKQRGKQKGNKQKVIFVEGLIERREGVMGENKNQLAKFAQL